MGRPAFSLVNFDLRRLPGYLFGVLLFHIGSAGIPQVHIMTACDLNAALWNMETEIKADSCQSSLRQPFVLPLSLLGILV